MLVEQHQGPEPERGAVAGRHRQRGRGRAFRGEDQPRVPRAPGLLDPGLAEEDPVVGGGEATQLVLETGNLPVDGCVSGWGGEGQGPRLGERRCSGGGAR